MHEGKPLEWIHVLILIRINVVVEQTSEAYLVGLSVGWQNRESMSYNVEPLTRVTLISN